jgi:hypothetical protein
VVESIVVCENPAKNKNENQEVSTKFFKIMMRVKSETAKLPHLAIKKAIPQRG